MPTCPKCGSANPRENTTCRKCGAVLESESTPASSQEQPTAVEETQTTETQAASPSVTWAELNLPRLFLFAGVAVLVLGIIWYLAEHFTGRPLAYIGLPAGWIIGQALYFGARGKRGRVLQWLSLGLTVALFIAVEVLVVATTAVPETEGADFSQKLLTWIQMDALGLFFLLIGLWQAYSVPAPRRPVRQGEEGAAETETGTEGETRSAETEGGEPATEEGQAEEPAPQETYLTCVRCKASVAESEAWVIPGRGRSGPVVICPQCGNELETQFEAETRDLNMGRAALYGVGAAIVAGVVWYLAEHFTKMPLPFIAWAGAWGIAEAARRGAGRKRGRPLQLLAVGLTLALIFGTQAAVLWPGPPESESYAVQAPNGAAFAYVSTREGNTDIYVRTASDSFRLTTDPAVDSQPAWSPDSAYLAFVSQRDGNSEIYGAEVPTATPPSGNVPQWRITHHGADDQHPTWSSDGLYIAFESDRDGDADLYIIRADGSETISLTNNTAYDGQPAWASDGRHIAFVSDRDGHRAIYVLTISGTTALTTTATQALGESPAWSKDGQRIVFVSEGDIYAMNADGSGQTRLTTGPATDDLPTWMLATDGTEQILFVSDRDGQPEIYGMGVDGSAQTCMTCEPRDVFQAFAGRMGDLFTPLLYILALWQAWNSGAPRRLIGVQKPQPQD